MSEFLNKVFDLANKDSLDESLDLINDHVDDLLLDGEFEKVDQIFEHLYLFHIESCLKHMSVPISFLMVAPKASDSKYPARRKFTDKLTSRMDPENIESYFGTLV